MKLANYNIIKSYRSRRLLKKFPVIVKALLCGIYSIRQNGLVVAYGQRFCLKDVKFLDNGLIEGYIVGSGCGTTAKATNKPGEAARLPVKIIYDNVRHKKFVSSGFVPEFFINSAEFIVCNEQGIFGAYTN